MPEDYPYSRFQDNGIEQCPLCGLTLGGQGGHRGPVYDEDGTHYDSLYDSDPAEGPFFCPDCHRERRVEEIRAEHRTLDEI
jgi:hypothetical protein